MIGDYFRYVAECAQADELEKCKEGALKHYNLAKEVS